MTPHQAKYLAYELSRRGPAGSLDKIAGALADAKVDLNPHQVEAALFAFKSPLSNGAILADEVGLGKTIEAGNDEAKHMSGFCLNGLRGEFNNGWVCATLEAICIIHTLITARKGAVYRRLHEFFWIIVSGPPLEERFCLHLRTVSGTQDWQERNKGNDHVFFSTTNRKTIDSTLSKTSL